MITSSETVSSVGGTVLTTNSNLFGRTTRKPVSYGPRIKGCAVKSVSIPAASSKLADYRPLPSLLVVPTYNY